MAETFMFAVNAVMPILLVIALGFLIKKSGFGDDTFFSKVNTLCFRVFLPISLYNNVYNIQSLGSVKWGVVIYCVIGVFLSCFIGYVGAKLFVMERRRKGVVIQCAFRSNYAIIGLSLAEALGGVPAVAFASIISAVSIPLYNMLAVITLTSYGTGADEKAGWGGIIKKTVTNPLIIAIVMGLITLCIRSVIRTGPDGLPVFTIKTELPFFYSAFQNAGRIASPLMLVVLGTQFSFKSAANMMKEIFTGVVLRLLATPVICIGIAILIKDVLGLTAVEMPALIALFGTPAAVSTVVMAQECGGDGQLAGQLVVWTSILSMFTLIFIIFVLKRLALL